MSAPFFADVDRIRYEGPDSDNPMGFRWYDADRVVLGALRQLSDRQRSCLVLRFYLQLSEREIAETLSISNNSVKTHCRRGMAALESLLEDER